MRVFLHLTLSLAVLSAFVSAPAAHRHDGPSARRVVHAHLSPHHHSDGPHSDLRLTSGDDAVSDVDLFVCTAQARTPELPLLQAVAFPAPDLVPGRILPAPRPAAHDPPFNVAAPLRAPPA